MVNWDKNSTDDEGNIDFNRVKETLVYTCPHCNSEWLPTKEQLHSFNTNSTWIPQNEASNELKGFHTTAFTFLDAYTLVCEYLNGCSRAKDGDFSRLKILHQKRLAEAWNEQNEVILTSTKEVEG
jgi:hypothetical protein